MLAWSELAAATRASGVWQGCQCHLKGHNSGQLPVLEAASMAGSMHRGSLRGRNVSGHRLVQTDSAGAHLPAACPDPLFATLSLREDSRAVPSSLSPVSSLALVAGSAELRTGMLLVRRPSRQLTGADIPEPEAADTSTGYLCPLKYAQHNVLEVAQACVALTQRQNPFTGHGIVKHSRT